MTATHSAAQLMQLRQTELVCSFDDYGVCVGYIEPGFDDGCAYKNIEASVIKVAHHLLKFGFFHLPVTHANTCFRN